MQLDEVEDNDPRKVLLQFCSDHGLYFDAAALAQSCVKCVYTLSLHDALPIYRKSVV